MAEKTMEKFKSVLDVLINANPHARNKGNEFKDWIKEIFDCDARISYIKEQRQITNRVSEQFRYFAPIVVFVCVPEVKRDTLTRYILERDYNQLESVAIIGVTTDSGSIAYTFEKLITFKESEFASWIKDEFSSVEDALSLKEELGLTSNGVVGTADGESSIDESTRIEGGTNVLLYGVPGSGKSWTIAHEYCTPETMVERVVFHPDYTNADFVGQILPIVDPEDKMVTYDFTPGPFTTILREAYTHPTKEYVLVIEEINRGNAPAIFGDIFQLLDRAYEPFTEGGITYKAGTSAYGITNKSVAKVVYEDETAKVRIPSNLSIYGTMNTSDQNVFTLDTAFQRRWRMRLIENNFDNVRASLANAEILDTGVVWSKFCDTINAQIIGNKAKVASSEDKRLGVYFIHETDLEFDAKAVPSEGYTDLYREYIDLLNAERDKTITTDQAQRLKELRAAIIKVRVFPEKVIKYLWDDAFKFNPEVIFDTENMDCLEKVIRTFVFNTGSDRLRVFKQHIRNLLSGN